VAFLPWRRASARGAKDFLFCFVMSSFSRRVFLRGSAALAAGLTLPPFLQSCAAQVGIKTKNTAAPKGEAQRVRGVVFLDTDNSGKRKPDSRGIAGVGVSNGRDIVQTDAQGRYELLVDEDSVVFVIKPSGYSVPLSAHNLPRFYHVHKPQGSPTDWRYAGIAPTGPLPQSLDFALRPQKESEQFRVLLFGDPQPRSLKEVDYVARDVVDELVGVQAAFGLSLGDNAFNNLNVLEPLNEVIGQIGVPWHSVIGNHDLNFEAPNDELAAETFKRIYGPTYYSFDYGAAHFVVLDNVIWLGGGTDLRGRNYTGGFGERQLAWLKRDLELVPREKLVVLLMHIPLVTLRDEGGAAEEEGDLGGAATAGEAQVPLRRARQANKPPRFSQDDKNALLALLANRPHTLSISAHTHVQYHAFLDREDGWMGAGEHHHFNCGTVSGSWWSGAPDEQGIPNTVMRDGTPNGYAFLNISGANYDLEWRSARRPANYQMNIFAPMQFRTGEARSVAVNVFNGSSKTKVEMRLNDASWASMKRTPAQDPGFAALKAIESELPVFERGGAKPPWRPIPNFYRTSHLWGAEVPADLKPGVHTLEVRVTEPNGRTFSDRRLLRVARDTSEL
jgi:hypothetical protein